MTTRESMLTLISDLSKAARGYRVRMDYDAMSDAELTATWDAFQDEADATSAREAAAHLQAQRDWEGYILGLMIDHGISRANALRWDMAAEGAQDIGFYCYLRGLDYALEPRIRAELRG